MGHIKENISFAKYRKMEENIVKFGNLYTQIAELIQSARKQVVTQVNTTLLLTYWNVGRPLVIS